MVLSGAAMTGSMQNKIISAEASYGKSDWVWLEEARDEQNFLVCNSVSFKAYEYEVGVDLLCNGAAVQRICPWCSR